MAETYEITNEASETERTSEEIQQSIVAKEQDIAESVKEIGERIKEKLDWREYVGQSPYVAMGIAAGIGLLASRMVPKRPTAIGRIMATAGEEVGYGISRALRGAGKTAFSLSLWSFASTMAAGFAKRAISKALLGEGAGGGSSPKCVSTSAQETAGERMRANK